MIVMDILKNQIDKNNVEQQKAFDLVANTNTCLFITGKAGTGKTTFIKALCEELGVDDTVTSPTFAIVNEYEVDEHARLTDDEYARIRPSRICHFDFYRIKRLEEVYDMGYEEYFYSDALCLVEWPELIEDLLPQDAVRVTIAVDEHGMRTVSVED